MFEKASRLKLRFITDVGNLSTEDLWDLNLKQLNILAKSINKIVREDEEVDFLEEENSENLILKLKFDIVLHVLNVKKEEKKIALESIKRRKERDKILDIIEKKQDESLENLSEEELKKKLNELQ